MLTAKGVVDDPYAARMLTLSMRAAAAFFALPLVRRRTDSAFFAALASRTAFFDTELVTALDAGIDQVVTIGAGYDARPWRFARPGVRFFEVDHPATQADKVRRAPSAGPTYVPLDLLSGSLAKSLAVAGFDWTRPAVFVIEGVTMYFESADVHQLLADIAAAAAPASRLLVNFSAPRGTGSSQSRRRQRVLEWVGGLRGEPFRSGRNELDPAGLVASAGWSVDTATTMFDVAPKILGPTSLKVAGINPTAFLIVATVAQ